MRLLRHDMHTFTGVYALDALDNAERERFERHLHRCQACAGEVRGLRETATMLAVAVARQPPPALRERVLAAVARTRQLPPVGEQQPRPEPRPVWRTRLAVAMAAVCLVAALVLGITQIATQHQLDRAQARNRAVAALLAAPDARIMTKATAAGGTVAIVVSRQQHKMIVTAAGLPPLPSAKVYELWLIGSVKIRPAGLLPAPAAGRAGPVLVPELLPGDRLGLTVEPAGGSAQPTTKPILVAPLRT